MCFIGIKRVFLIQMRFFNKMNQLGINVIVNLKPGILEKHPFKEEFEANDVFVKDCDG